VADWLVLTLPAEAERSDGRARARLRLEQGDVVHLALQRSTLGDAVSAHVWTQPALAELLDRTLAAWESWCDVHQSYDGPWQDLVHFSGRVLFGLSYQPSGAIVAAGTTSLPEDVGGERNWDYRFSWVRDASFTMEALWVAACPDEAHDFFAFMTTAAAGGIGPENSLQIMFGIAGEHDLSERTLGHLRGWRDSRPVRVGNGAWNQRQVDVYGELSAQRPGCPTSCPVWTRRPACSSPPAPTPPPSAGATATRASGRCAAIRSTSCTRRSCAGWRWTGRSPWPRC
jgi:alpha,alpha-trehalase